MGCDIHCYAEKQTLDGYEMIDKITPFAWRSYGLFAFLAGIRNYSAIKPISKPRGLPVCSIVVKEEYNTWVGDAHSASWLSLEELIAFNYDEEMEDRRCMRNNNGGSTCEIEEGKKMSYRQFLGDEYFEELNKLKEAGANRIVFWFDN